MTLRMLGSGERWQVWHGDHAELAAHLAETGVRPDSLIVDAPYSKRTHAGHAEGVRSADKTAEWAAKRGLKNKRARRARLEYAYWTPADVERLVAAWHPLVTGWLVSITDHVLAPAWEAAYLAAYRYAFAPFPLVEWGGRVRLGGDGPANWSCPIITCRPRSAAWLAAWREERRAHGLPTALPGAYEASSERHRRDDEDARTTGGKPVAAMAALVRDYVPRGGLVVDPCCGSGSTGVGAMREGASFIGCDLSETEAAKACRRIEREARQGRLFDAPVRAEQRGLFSEEG